MRMFLVDWRYPTGKGRYPDGDLTVESFDVELCRLMSDGEPQFENRRRGNHYEEWYGTAEEAYRVADSIKAELGIKALYGTLEGYKKDEEERNRRLKYFEDRGYRGICEAFLP